MLHAVLSKVVGELRMCSGPGTDLKKFYGFEGVGVSEI